MIRLALIDGPLVAGHRGLARQVVFREGPDGPAAPHGTSHATAHATALADAALSACPDLQIDNLVIFGGGLSTDAATVARALAAVEADVALCAFGLARADPAIAAAVAALTARGTAVVAAAPARGGPVWPAACPGVLAVQGDARCAPADWSHLALPHAAFGACPAIPDHPGVGGASAAAAHLAGIVAGLRSAGVAPGDIAPRLAAGAKWHGRERRSAAV